MSGGLGMEVRKRETKLGLLGMYLMAAEKVLVCVNMCVHHVMRTMRRRTY